MDDISAAGCGPKSAEPGDTDPGPAETGGSDPGPGPVATGGADAADTSQTTPPPGTALDRLGDDAAARACLSAAVEPGDPVLGALLAEHDATVVWDSLRTGRPLRRPADAAPGPFATRVRRWSARAAATVAESLLASADDLGLRLIPPGGPEWPGQLDDLADRRPVCLWVRGSHDLRFACLRSVAMVGSRAATGYGLHVAADLGCALAEHTWTLVSGGAYGIDAAAHRGALAGGAPTVAALACGLDIAYPRGHENLFADIAARGVLVSEHPPGTAPTRRGFLVRNRLIAALSAGTVVVEAGLRSGAMSTAAHTRDLCRALMAVPGPVTSALSAGCHRLLRDYQAVCVTCAADIIEQVGHVGSDLRAGGGSGLSRDLLDPDSRAVLDSVPRRGGAGAASIAAANDLPLDTALRRLGLLAAGGFIERGPTGWRVRPDTA
ncbi:DNA processing protein [Murinocardiopsis flavida]|uniref:DNA processing protein n=1 Tax=Murinocardiopsis flavida TaxID=645275 RepID=A0A2P8DEK8_9ACTN|nr:DNA-processing protein DprA [Murinocardiopsis flavida]PSK95661.1 DNA processing protein [Murinocardiopsis flavida]